MAFVERPQGARIWWGSMGRGEPVVMLMGLGCSSALWFRVAPRLARTHRVILIDNRGTGQTHVPGAVVHRVPHMAADVAAVLDAAGEPDAHVIGFSMGGMIAQQVAVDFPHRVRSLALLVDRLLVERAEEMAHPVGFHPQKDGRLALVHAAILDGLAGLVVGRERRQAPGEVDQQLELLPRVEVGELADQLVEAFPHVHHRSGVRHGGR